MEIADVPVQPGEGDEVVPGAWRETGPARLTRERSLQQGCLESKDRNRNSHRRGPSHKASGLAARAGRATLHRRSEPMAGSGLWVNPAAGRPYNVLQDEFFSMNDAGGGSR